MDGALSLNETRARLQQLGLRPSKRLGQNFLIDGNVVGKSLEFARIQAGDTCVEIGPGLGTLTGALLAAGATVYAVEYDHRLATYLKTYFASAIECGTLHVTHADAVALPLGGLPLGVEDYKIVANLPYAISSPWVEGVLQSRLPLSLTLMVQREAAERYLAQPGSGSYGAVSILLQSAYEAAGQHPVSNRCFFPAPEITSKLVHLRRRSGGEPLPPAAYALVRRLFTQRRKQLGSLCRGNDSLERWLLGQGLPTTARPQEVALDHWQALAGYLKDSRPW